MHRTVLSESQICDRTAWTLFELTSLTCSSLACPLKVIIHLNFLNVLSLLESSITQTIMVELIYLYNLMQTPTPIIVPLFFPAQVEQWNGGMVEWWVEWIVWLALTTRCVVLGPSLLTENINKNNLYKHLCSKSKKLLSCLEALCMFQNFQFHFHYQVMANVNIFISKRGSHTILYYSLNGLLVKLSGPSSAKLHARVWILSRSFTLFLSDFFFTTREKKIILQSKWSAG